MTYGKVYGGILSEFSTEVKKSMLGKSLSRLSAVSRFTTKGVMIFLTLVKESQTNWLTPEWGFPKGRRNYQETDITCAYREFNEETGFYERRFRYDY